MGNVAAFFDIDGTLYRDSLMTEHFKKLIKYEADSWWWDQLSAFLFLNIFMVIFYDNIFCNIFDDIL